MGFFSLPVCDSRVKWIKYWVCSVFKVRVYLEMSKNIDV